MSLLKSSFRENKLGWYASHRNFTNQIIRRQAKVILLGDSIMANLARYPCVWDHHLQPFNTVNCGVGGDRTQHVLWRAENMYLPASVSVATILCGTNNMDNNVYQPHDIADSVIACGTKLREKHPHLKVIVVGILPPTLTRTSTSITTPTPTTATTLTARATATTTTTLAATKNLQNKHIEKCQNKNSIPRQNSLNKCIFPGPSQPLMRL